MCAYFTQYDKQAPLKKQGGDYYPQKASRGQRSGYQEKRSRKAYDSQLSYKPHYSRKDYYREQDGLLTRSFNAITDFRTLISNRSGEGPTSLRALSFIGGIMSAATAALAASQIHRWLSDPPHFILLIYQFCFGVVTMVIEAKNLTLFEQIQPWISTWFPFLTEPLGKGFLFILMGVLGISLWKEVFYVACAGSFMSFIGCLYLIVSCGGYQRLSTVGIELTQHPSRNPQKIPQFGQHRTKSFTRDSLPQFGNEERAMYSFNEGDQDDYNRYSNPPGKYANKNRSKRDDYSNKSRFHGSRTSPTLEENDKDDEDETNTTKHNEPWLYGEDKYPVEYLDGLRQHNIEQANIYY